MSADGVRALVRESRSWAGQSSFVSDPIALRSVLQRFVSQMPDPESVLEELAFRGVLLDVAMRLSTAVHRQFHARYPGDCSFDPAGDVSRYWRDPRSPVRVVFQGWASTFLTAFIETHRLPLSARARAFIDANYRGTFSVRTVARALGCHDVQLRAQFKREFGITIREYHTRVRVLHAAQLLAGSDLKVDAIANQVGFHSRKNFYRAFHRILQSTPSELRTRSLREIAALSRTVLAE
jgi:AraC-like DNA-binding protein